MKHIYIAAAPVWAPPDWRRQAADELRHVQPLPAKIDADLATLVRLRRQTDAQAAHPRALTPAEQAIIDAGLLAGTATATWVQALVLADAPAADIGAQLGVDVDTIQAYERFHFDLRRHLALRNAVRIHLNTVMRAPTADWLRLQVGLELGRDAVLQLLRNDLSPELQATLDAWRVSRQRILAVEAAFAQRVNAVTVPQIMRQHIALLRFELAREKFAARQAADRRDLERREAWLQAGFEKLEQQKQQLQQREKELAELADQLWAQAAAAQAPPRAPQVYTPALVALPAVAPAAGKSAA